MHDPDVAVCFRCTEAVDLDNIVFDSLCGHAMHATLTFHPLCLMQWREEREQMKRDYMEHFGFVNEPGEEREA